MAKIGEMLGLGNNPLYQGFAANRNAFSGAFGGMAANPMNPWGGFAQGAAYGGQQDQLLADQKAAEAQEQEAKNSTIEWLQSQGYDDLVQMAQATGDIGAAWSEGLKRTNPGAGASAPANVQEWQYYSSLSPEDQSRYLTMKRSNSPLNIGTGFVTQDMANPGQLLGGPIAIENEQAAFDTATGTGLGKVNAENIAAADSLTSKLPGLRTVVDELGQLAQIATYTQTGQLIDTVMRETGQEPSEAAIARRKYIAMVDNQILPLLRDTFGAAFTAKEGETLRATLGDPNLSPAEKQVVLEAFIEQKERDAQSMQSRVPSGAGQGGDIDEILGGYGL